MFAITGAGKLGFRLLINTLLCHGRDTQNKHTNMNIDELVKKAQTAEPKRKAYDKYGVYLPVIDALLAKGFSLWAATKWLKENEPSLIKSHNQIHAAFWQRYHAKKQKAQNSR